MANQFKQEVKQTLASSTGRWVKKQQDMGWIEFPNGIWMRPSFSYNRWEKDEPGTGSAALSDSEASSSSSSSSSSAAAPKAPSVGTKSSSSSAAAATAPAVGTKSSGSSGSKQQPHCEQGAASSTDAPLFKVTLTATGKRGT